jgi:hypothetical protein
MKTSFYHESFDFAPEFEALGEKVDLHTKEPYALLVMVMARILDVI